MREFTREQWLEFGPEIYLADGYLDDGGHLRGDFLGDYVTAATTRLLAAEVSPQEVAFVFEALRLLLPEYEGPARQRLVGALTEAFQVVARAIRQNNNEGLVQWLNVCASRVTTEADLEAFLAHLQAVIRRYYLVASMVPEPGGSDSPASSLAH